MGLTDAQWHPHIEGFRHYREACGLLFGNDGRHKQNLEAAFEELNLAVIHHDIKAKKLRGVFVLEGETSEIEAKKVAFADLSYVDEMGDEDSGHRIKEYIQCLNQDDLFSIGSYLYDRGYESISLEMLTRSANLGCKNASNLIELHKNRSIPQIKPHDPVVTQESRTKKTPPKETRSIFIPPKRDPAKGLYPPDWMLGAGWER